MSAIWSTFYGDRTDLFLFFNTGQWHPIGQLPLRDPSLLLPSEYHPTSPLLDPTSSSVLNLCHIGIKVLWSPFLFLQLQQQDFSRPKWLLSCPMQVAVEPAASQLAAAQQSLRSSTRGPKLQNFLVDLSLFRAYTGSNIHSYSALSSEEHFLL